MSVSLSEGHAFVQVASIVAQDPDGLHAHSGRFLLLRCERPLLDPFARRRLTPSASPIFRKVAPLRAHDLMSLPHIGA
ncbi:hypothetical protein J2W22_001595 [Sphingomonas kyeonggiensis]|uniref:hypothetical protein n=1 Tax=Sphingomonas kyeonggiensis TaxID=1268553 RepID=UPI0027832230|nr:hypothetical protein [Sphingomonas kyeonggiensis]MDQ0249548.1 hypothetical protein [Sphingomonas kyeonggiensis]